MRAEARLHEEYALKITVEKKADQAKLDNEYLALKDNIQKNIEIKEDLEKKIENLHKANDITIEHLKKQTEERTEELCKIGAAAADQYFLCLDKEYENAEAAYSDKINKLKSEQQEAEKNLQTIKNSLSAGISARIREEERKDKLSFYKLTPTENELADIIALEAIKPKLHNPIILSKLIWTTYFQKPTKELCSRVLGTKTITGIYKITNIQTERVYIGQAVDMSKRWVDHIKYGLGIDTPSTIRLYKDMKEYGVWNYTFELLEQCPIEELNQKEKQWIEMYQSNIYGLNMQGGNK